MMHPRLRNESENRIPGLGAKEIIADDVDVAVRFGSEELLVEFPAEGVTVSVPLAVVGDRLYRLEGVPVMAESAAFGDIIEAEVVSNGRLRFVRGVEPGRWRTFNYILPPHKIDSEADQWLFREFEARGGHWEQVFGGLLFLRVPLGLDLDPSPRVELP